MDRFVVAIDGPSATEGRGVFDELAEVGIDSSEFLIAEDPGVAGYAYRFHSGCGSSGHVIDCVQECCGGGCH